ncbi:MAG TPA: hypothetical protein VGC29_03800 [Flavisolibacter sp.]
MKHLFLSCLLCSIDFLARSQVSLSPMAHPYALNAYGSIQKEPGLLWGQAAALGAIQNFSAGLYGEQRFMLRELSRYQFKLALPVTGGGFGLDALYSGNSSFHSSGLGLAYGKKMGKLDAGLQFNYHRLATTGYGSASYVSVDAGAILQVNDQFRTGLQIHYPANGSLNKSIERAAIIYTTGFGYQVSDKFFAAAEIRKTENLPVQVHAGLQYSFDQKVFALLGIESGSSSFYFGGGFLLDRFRIDVTASLHPYLGITPGMMIVFNQPQKQ